VSIKELTHSLHPKAYWFKQTPFVCASRRGNPRRSGVGGLTICDPTGWPLAGLGRARKESLENQCPLMHLSRCCGFSLRSKQNARALYRWHERVKNGKIKEIFVRLFCLAKVRSVRRRQSSSGNEKRSTESQTGTPHANRGVVRKMKIKRIKKHVVHFKNAVESVQIRFW